MKAKNIIQRHTFSRIPKLVDLPDLLDIQLASFRRFIQAGVRPEERERVGLNSVFLNVFPIIDNREEHILEFSHYPGDLSRLRIQSVAAGFQALTVRLEACR